MRCWDGGPERLCPRSSGVSHFEAEPQWCLDRAADKEADIDQAQVTSAVPPAGFEPAISALKGLRPGPLDDRGRSDALVALLSIEPRRAID